MNSKATVYRIYTERKNVKQISRFVTEHFQGFTIYDAIGYWQGTKERSMVIEILAAPNAAYYIREICMKIKGYNRQAVVLLTKHEIVEDLI